MADQKINALPTKTSPTTGDKVLMSGAAEEYLIDYDQLATEILNKLTSKTYTLDQGTKTLIAALNELNSKSINGKRGIFRLLAYATNTKTLNMAIDVPREASIINATINASVFSVSGVSSSLPVDNLSILSAATSYNQIAIEYTHDSDLFTPNTVYWCRLDCTLSY